MPIDHFAFKVHPSEYEKIVDWYLAALAPLGYTKQVDIPERACGLGTSKFDAKFWIGKSEDSNEKASSAFHLAFTAEDHVTVDKFYDEALKAGGKDNGKPGTRTMYHPNYYGAFVLDPLG